MSATSALENDIITHLLRTGSWTKPTTIYVALFTVIPNDDGGGGTEVTGGSYARVQHGPLDASWDAPVNGVTANTTDITFPVPTANWGTVNSVGFFTAATGGTAVHVELLQNSRTILSGDPAPKFLAGEFSFTVD